MSKGHPNSINPNSINPDSINTALTAHELITTTRAVRRRLDLTRPVPRSLVVGAVADAVQAPQGSNMMRTEFIVVDDPAVIAEIGRIYREVFEEFYLDSATGVFQRTDADADHAAQTQRTQDSVRYLADHFAEVPLVVIPCLTPRLADNTLEAKHRLATVYPTVWNFLLAARLRGIGSCWTGMTLMREREIAGLVGIDHDQVEQACVIPMAMYTGDSFKPAWRPDPETFIHWDRW